VQKAYTKKKTPGFEGEREMYGEPLMILDQKVELTSEIYPDRNGSYYVYVIEINFGTGGFHQKVKLGDKVI